MNFYVYAHINLVTNKIFYIGKGKGDRAYTKESRNPHWHNTVKKYDYEVLILDDNLAEEEAFNLEKRYIFMLGVNNLTNMTLGGEGVSGLKHSEETKQKMKGNQYRKGIPHSEETKKKMSEMRNGKTFGPMSDEIKTKISKSKKGKVARNKGVPMSEEQKQKQSIAMKERWKLKKLLENKTNFIIF